MIRILADSTGWGVPPTGALVGQSTADYVPLRIALRQALNTGAPLIVYVSNPVLLAALADLRGYRGVEWDEQSPMQRFMQLFGCPPETPFSIQVLDALPLEQVPQPDAVVDPVGWILRHLLDPLWGREMPQEQTLAHMIRWAHTSPALPEALWPLVDWQLARWGETQIAFRSLHAGSLVADTQQLLIRAALTRYDATWRMAQPWAMLPEIALTGLDDLVTRALTTMQMPIRTYWRMLAAQPHDPVQLVQQMLYQMSGHDTTELTELMTILQQHPTLLTPSLLDQLVQRFRLPAFTRVLPELRAMVTPDRPAMPETPWDDAAWLSWATQEYIPYFAWCVRQHTSRIYCTELATAFSDWLYKRYPQWIASDTSPLVTQQFRQARELLEQADDSYVLWVIVDGMAWWHGEMLLTACREQGLFPQDIDIGVALVPSITSISKRGLLTGVPMSSLGGNSVAEAGRHYFAARELPAEISYHAADILTALRKPDPPRCLVLLWNMLDVLAHKMTDMTDSATIAGSLQELARHLGQIQTACAYLGKALHVVVGSDHGGTLLAPEAQLLPLPTSARKLDDIWAPESADTEQSRVSARAAQIAEPARADADPHWYVLSRELFRLETHYVVTRGDSYLGRRPEGWTHGGLTPEEVLVPLLHLHATEMVVLPLHVEISGSFRAGQEGVLSVHLTNPNLILLLQGELWIADRLIVTGIQLAPGSTSTQEIAWMPPAGTSDHVTLPWQVRYHALGTAHSDAGMAEITVRRLSIDDSFDNLFGA